MTEVLLVNQVILRLHSAKRICPAYQKFAAQGALYAKSFGGGAPRGNKSVVDVGVILLNYLPTTPVVPKVNPDGIVRLALPA